MDQATLQFINTFAPWLSAIGTFTAVIVALYLANRDRRIRLTVNAGLRKIAMMGQSLAQGTDVVDITVTNIGYRTTKINSIYWKIGIFKKATFVQIPGIMPWSAQLPTKIGDGDQASFPLELSIWGEDIEQMLKAIPPLFPRFGVRSIKIGVLTSTGKRCESRIEKPFQKWFLEQLREKKV